MNGFGTIVDTYAILMLDATSGAKHEQVLKFRETLRAQLRAFEDMHGLPHSFKTKTEMSQRELDEHRRHERST